MALMSRQRPSPSRPATSVGNMQKKPTAAGRRASSATRPALRPLVLVNRTRGTSNEGEKGDTKGFSKAGSALGDAKESSSARGTNSKLSAVVQKENIARRAQSATASKSSGTTSMKYSTSQKLPTVSGPTSKPHVAAIPSKRLEQSGLPSSKSQRMSMISETRQSRPFRVSSPPHRRAQSLSLSKPSVPAATNTAQRTSDAGLPPLSTKASAKPNVNLKKRGSVTATRTASVVSLSAVAGAKENPAGARVQSGPALPSRMEKKTVSSRASESLAKPLRSVMSSGKTAASDPMNANNVTVRKPSERKIIKEVVPQISTLKREGTSESWEEILQDIEVKIVKTIDVIPSMSVLPSPLTASTAAATTSMHAPQSRVEVAEAPGAIMPPSIPPARSFLRSLSVDILNLPPFVLPPLSLTLAGRMKAFTSYSRSRLDLARIAGGGSETSGSDESVKPYEDVDSTGSQVDKGESDALPEKYEQDITPTSPQIPQIPDKSSTFTVRIPDDIGSPSQTTLASISTKASSGSLARQCPTPSVITQTLSPGPTPPPATVRLTIPRHLENKVVGDSSTQMELEFLRAGAKGCSVLDRARVFAAGAQGRAVASAALANGGKGRAVAGGQLSLRAMAIVHRLKNGEGRA
ncbi:hypothetical protein BD410DRAFT_823318 [Rickenella mellea]|uniref:Uncharacterized protein n=1 Tax=Rickenella mellea TaxID=50990 RepID=A0A4R5XDF6_9AGAM|nr:hypothetical protein BD410DRAFT_823318 [Rickenella mellea]